MIQKLLVILLLLMPAISYSQGRVAHKHKHKHKHRSHKTAKARVLPPWAAAHHYDATAHVYFPDYYTFYDPARGGYVYWDDGGYKFSPAVPAFLEKVDMSKTRIQILKGISLELHPELDYPYYMKMYPPDANGNTLVPVPIPGNPAH